VLRERVGDHKMLHGIRQRFQGSPEGSTETMKSACLCCVRESTLPIFHQNSLNSYFSVSPQGPRA
jgi:hypothetical protein